MHAHSAKDTNDHNEKDIKYHNDIASEYDRMVVEPRLVTNNAVYSKLMRFIPSGEIMLDLGCGTGHLTGRVGAKFQKVVAVDHSLGMLNEARKKAARWGYQHVEFIQSNAMEFVGRSQSARFDFVGCVGFLHHLQAPDIREILSQIYRILKPRGRALFQEPIRIASESLPRTIARWNSKSVVTRMQYTGNPPLPDEEHLDRELFGQWLTEANFLVRYSSRNWEIFPRALPAPVSDKLYIRIMNFLHGRSGNVFSVLVEKR